MFINSLALCFSVPEITSFTPAAFAVQSCQLLLCGVNGPRALIRELLWSLLCICCCFSTRGQVVSVRTFTGCIDMFILSPKPKRKQAYLCC